STVVVVPVVVRVFVPLLVLMAVLVRGVARQLSLKCLEVRGGNAVLELPGHFRLLGLSSAAPHGSTPLRGGGAAGGNRRPRVLSTTISYETPSRVPRAGRDAARCARRATYEDHARTGQPTPAPVRRRARIPGCSDHSSPICGFTIRSSPSVSHR